MKRVLPIVLVLGLFSLLCAQSSPDPLNEVGTVVENAESTIKTVLHTAGTLIIAMMPLLLFAIGIFGGIKYAKRQSEQDQDNTKMYVSAAIGGTAGAIVGLLIVSLIGVVLLGGAGEGLDVLTGFWSEVLNPGTTTP
jgi:dipeptide/tripeptide permease